MFPLRWYNRDYVELDKALCGRSISMTSRSKDVFHVDCYEHTLIVDIVIAMT